MIVQGVVQRLVSVDGALPFVEWRTRDHGALLVETEWGWSRLADDAYVFPQYSPALLPSHAYEQSATDHAAALNAAGDRRACPMVHGSEARAAREVRRASRDAALDATVREIPPSTVYFETARRMGERES